jgi:hypothetical protein
MLEARPRVAMVGPNKRFILCFSIGANGSILSLSSSERIEVSVCRSDVFTNQICLFKKLEFESVVLLCPMNDCELWALFGLRTKIYSHPLSLKRLHNISQRWSVRDPGKVHRKTLLSPKGLTDSIRCRSIP